MRDFVNVEDCVKVNLWFMKNPSKSGIFNIGTGIPETFNSVAKNVMAWNKSNKNLNGSISYIPFPNELKGSYQSFTKANIKKLRSIGYTDDFDSIKIGIKKYLDWIESKNNKV